MAASLATLTFTVLAATLWYKLALSDNIVRQQVPHNKYFTQSPGISIDPDDNVGPAVNFFEDIATMCECSIGFILVHNRFQSVGQQRQGVWSWHRVLPSVLAKLEEACACGHGHAHDDTL